MDARKPVETKDCQVASAGALAEWLILSGETMEKGERSEGMKLDRLLKRGPRNPCAKVMADAIKLSKLEVAEIATRAKVSRDLVHKSKRDGFTDVTTKIGRICEVLGIDGEAALRGKFVQMKADPASITDPWQSIENEFIGTDQYDAIKAVLGSARNSVSALKKAARPLVPKVNRKT